MKPLSLLAAAAGALTVLTACSQSPGTSAPQPSPVHSSVSIHATVLVNCPQRYNSWKNGPAKNVLTAVNAVDSATTAGGIQAEISALKRAAPAVATAESYPMPTCADPKGYWNALLLHVNAAAGSAKSGVDTDTVRLALKSVPQLNRELRAELAKTAAAK